MLDHQDAQRLAARRGLQPPIPSAENAPAVGGSFSVSP
jgi:hypothetical protein